jgi:hypothetical protein
MESPVGAEWLLWLRNSVLAEAVRGWFWAYPFVKALHILGISLLVGSVAMFDLRLLETSHHVRVADMARHLLPWSYASFGIALLSGFLLFATDAPAIALNPAFQLKLGLIVCAAMNAIVFHWRFYPSVRRWNQGVKTPWMVRAIAILSLLLWISVILCGCFIAYV